MKTVKTALFLLLCVSTSIAQRINPNTQLSGPLQSGNEMLPGVSSMPGGVLAGGALQALSIPGDGSTPHMPYTAAQLAQMKSVTLAQYAGNGIGGGLLVWVPGSSITPDGCSAFAGADDPTGTQGVMVRQITGSLYPEMCGAVGDDATDDTAALQRWAAAKNFMKAMMRKTYRVSGTINMNGELGALIPPGGDISPVIRWGVEARGAAIHEMANNIPIMTIYGSRGTWDLPRMYYDTLQTVTITAPNGFVSCTSSSFGTTCNPYAVGLMVDPYPDMGALYMSRDVRFVVENAAVGFGVARAFDDTLASDATSSGIGSTGTTTLSMTTTPTDISGLKPWIPQMYAQLQLDNGNWFVARIKSVNPLTNTVVLQGVLPSSARAGRYLVHSAALQTAGGGPGLSPLNNFSNTISYAEVFQPTFEGWYDHGAGTSNKFLNRYIHWNPCGDNWHCYGLVKNAIFEDARSQDVLGQTNIEHLISYGSMWIHNSADGTVDAGTVHCEGCGLVSEGTAIFDWATANAGFDSVSIEYGRMVADNSDLPAPFNATITNGVGIFKPEYTEVTDPTPSTAFTGRGQWTIRQLSTLENTVDASSSSAPIAFLVRGFGTGNYSEVHIGTWTNTRDSGFYPGGALVYPAMGPAPIIDNVMPEDTVAYNLKMPIDGSTGCTGVASQRLYASVSNWLPEAIIVNGGSPWVGGSPTGGIYTSPAGCSTLLTSTNTNSIAASSQLANFVLPLSATAQNQLYNVDTSNNPFFYLSAAAGSTSINNATGSWCTGRNGGATNTNLCFINLASAPSPAVTPGQLVVVSGSANKGLQGTVTAFITDVPSSTQIALYVNSLACTNYDGGPDSTCGTSAAPTPESALSITVRPTVNVFIKGSKF
ncbi:MAG TPA: hypothetical protein VHB45_12885 [Alloacidobacterium sp.]|nr:hypothetical protein [Alloacidobacterium sp.]